MEKRVKIHPSSMDPRKTNAELVPLVRNLAPRNAPTKRQWEALIKSGLVDERFLSNDVPEPSQVTFVREGILKQALTEFAKKAKAPNRR